jgi:hypothetical protein
MDGIDPLLLIQTSTWRQAPMASMDPQLLSQESSSNPSAWPITGQLASPIADNALGR